jgi:PTH1 family peptidyl-tRNA hydrolase
MKLFIGLGNPGKKYEQNRHNFGFMAIDAIAKQLDAPDFIEKSSGLFAKTKEVILFKPMTFMNNSGVPSSKVASFYKILPQDIYVFYDELDVALGKVKIKNGGGDGGHNGIKSLDEHISKAYWRVRLGINHPGHKDLVHGHVLSDFTPEERPLAEKVTKTIAKHIDLLIKGERELFLTRFFES